LSNAQTLRIVIIYVDFVLLQCFHICVSDFKCLGTYLTKLLNLVAWRRFKHSILVFTISRPPTTRWLVNTLLPRYSCKLPMCVFTSFYSCFITEIVLKWLSMQFSHWHLSESYVNAMFNVDILEYYFVLYMDCVSRVLCK